jgi:hypothetical protein
MVTHERRRDEVLRRMLNTPKDSEKRLPAETDEHTQSRQEPNQGGENKKPSR